MGEYYHRESVMHHFFVNKTDFDGDRVFIRDSKVNHISNVLRMKPGEKLLICNGEDWDYLCEIESMSKSEIVLKIESENENVSELPVSITLFQGLPKSDKMELIIQKAVELGVAEIVPVNTRRVIVKFDAKKENKKMARWQEIARSAAEQSKRGRVPKVHPVMNLEEAFAYAKDAKIRLIPYELAKGMNRTREILHSIKKGQKIAVFIGPEGGFEESEIDAAISHGIEPITLGARILRTETAGFAILSNIMFAMDAGEE